MDLNDVLTVEQVHINLSATNKEDAIKQLADGLNKDGVLSNEDDFVQAVLQREAHSTTGIGNGVAIPHGKSDAVKKAAIAYAKLNTPLEWASLDDKPVEMVFLLAIPEEAKGDVHLKLLSDIAVKLMDDELLENLKQAQDPQQIINLLQN